MISYEPYSVIEPPLSEKFQTHSLQKVETASDGWYVTADWSCFVPRLRPDQLEPEVGDVLLTYGKGIGFDIQGMKLLKASGRAEVLWYRTAAQRVQHRCEYLARSEAKRLQEFLGSATETFAQMEKLPDDLRKQLVSKLDKDPSWAWEPMGLHYTLFAMREGVMLANKFSSIEDLESYYQASPEEQRTYVPELSDGHSGNTFGMAVSVAYSLIEAR